MSARCPMCDEDRRRAHAHVTRLSGHQAAEAAEAADGHGSHCECLFQLGRSDVKIVKGCDQVSNSVSGLAGRQREFRHRRLTRRKVTYAWVVACINLHA